MKITFIGGSGFVGTRLIELLKEDSTNYSKIKTSICYKAIFTQKLQK